MNRRKFINRSFAAAGIIMTTGLNRNSGNSSGQVLTVRIGITSSSADILDHFKRELSSITGYDLSSPVRTEECIGPGGFIRRTDFANGITIFSGTCYPEGISYS